ncbi:MAG TPA: tetratricopeptide repeat protein [Rhodothermales bacterium]|nr:tetratricopeptide repeat protein [Rhodothermales bacterium]
MSTSFDSKIAAMAVMLLVVAGCGGDRSDMARTEKQRLGLAPMVQQFLIEGERAYKNGNYLVALALTDSAEKYASDVADIHFLRGGIYTDLNQYEIADRAYETTLELDPEYRGAHMNLGINHARRGALRDAIKSFRNEEALKPNSNLYLELGRAYAKLGVADSAQAAYEKAIALDPTNASAIMWLGQLFEELGDFDKAIEYSMRGASLRPDNLDYKYIIGSQLFRTGNVEEAANYLRPVAEARPWHHGAQYNMGQVLMRMGEEKSAQEYLAQADTAQQWQQEINEARGAVERNPNDVRNWIRFGEAHRNAGMPDRAADAFWSAVALEPTNLGLQTNLATVMLESGDAKGAVLRYQAIVRMDSTFIEAWLNLGAAYGNSGEYDEARVAWGRVLELEPGNRRARAYLSQLRQMAGS